MCRGCSGAGSCPRCPNAPHMWSLGWGATVAQGNVQMGCVMPQPGDQVTYTLRAPLAASHQFVRLTVDSRNVYILGYKEVMGGCRRVCRL